MPNHARMLLILCAATGFQAQPQNTATSPGSDGQPATEQTVSPQQTTASKTVGQSSATLPDSTRLEPINTPKPEYPQAAREQRLQGQVVIHLEISESGDVESATAVSGEPILAEAAVAAMKKWKFKPYIKDGKAVRVRVQMPHNFALQEDVSKIKDADVPSAQQSPGTSSLNDAAGTNPTASHPPQKLRVSQEVVDGRKIHDVPPEYPLGARLRRIQGNVFLRATIGKDGLIHNLQAVSGPEVLVEAAMEAVKQWRYRPFLFNGEPVDVETIVRVRFRLP